MVGRNGEVFEGREIDKGGVGEVENNIDMYKINKNEYNNLTPQKIEKNRKVV
ncbi:MAG: hypothetical protein RSD97_10450 [Lachnospiraceae bacterium]